MRDKVMKALEGREWVLLNKYWDEYPTDWMRTINECLEDEDNIWEFRYDSKKHLKRIRIITNYGFSNSEWNFYIEFKD